MRLLHFISISALALLCTACASPTIKIGHAAPLTGALAHLGKDNENGARMAIDELNAKGIVIDGKPAVFELVPEDDGVNPALAVAAAKRLVSANVKGVVGHLNSGTTIPASKIYFDAHIPEISPSATNPRYTRQGFNTAFRIVADDQHIGEILGSYAAIAQGYSKIAIVDDGTAYGQGISNAFAKGATSSKPAVQVVAVEHTDTHGNNIGALIDRLQEANPQVIFYGGLDTVAGPMLREMHNRGMNTPFIGGDGICTDALGKMAGAAITNGQVICAEGGGITTSDAPGYEKWKAAYRAKFGLDVQIYAPYTYDAVMVIAEAMRQANSSEPSKYLPFLAQVKYHGVTGNIEFDRIGDIKEANVSIYTYNGGRRTIIGVTH